jgi:hypothetical protein
VTVLEPKERLLLLESLRPPVGFRFDEGIGTTYTLDLVALLTAPLAFTWFEQRDEGAGAESVNSLEIVESLRRYADRLTLFCHAGRIAVPRAHYPQLAFLEDAIVQCRPASGGAFHPKVWLLRFVPLEGGEVRYRLLVLSRNLTFSRAWDTMLTLDGTLKKTPVRQSGPVADFVRALPSFAAGHRVSADVTDRLHRLAGEVERVEFAPPPNVSDIAFAPLGLSGRRGDPLKNLRKTKRLLVISPFVVATQLEELASGRSEMWVVSTGAQLEGLSHTPKGHIRFFTLKDRVRSEPADGEAAPTRENEAIELADLHAKLYLTEIGAEAHVWTGSANATAAAFGGNVEFIAELTGPRKYLGLDGMMQAEKGELRFVNLLEPADDIVARAPTSPESKALEKKLDDVRNAVVSSGLVIDVSDAGDGAFHLSVRASGGLQIPDDVKATCWPSAVSAAGAVMATTAPGATVARFPAVSLAGVTSFLAFKLSAQANGDSMEIEFVLAVPLNGAPGGRREHVLRSLVKDRSRMLRFLWLLLADDVADIPMMSKNDPASVDDGDETSTGAPPPGGLLEALLRNLDRSPERLDYLDGLMTELRRDASAPDLFPPGFDAIWEPIWAERLRLKEKAR